MVLARRAAISVPRDAAISEARASKSLRQESLAGFPTSLTVSTHGVLGFVHDVVVVRDRGERLTRHPTSNNILRDSAVAKSTGNHGQDRTQSFAAGDNEILRKLREMLVGSLDGRRSSSSIRWRSEPSTLISGKSDSATTEGYALICVFGNTCNHRRFVRLDAPSHR